MWSGRDWRCEQCGKSVESNSEAHKVLSFFEFIEFRSRQSVQSNMYGTRRRKRSEWGTRDTRDTCVTTPNRLNLSVAINKRGERKKVGREIASISFHRKCLSRGFAQGIFHTCVHTMICMRMSIYFPFLFSFPLIFPAHTQQRLQIQINEFFRNEVLYFMFILHVPCVSGWLIVVHFTCKLFVTPTSDRRRHSNIN